jgi:hypothetical protein
MKVGPAWLQDTGGGIYNGGSNLTINSSLIMRNSSSQGGGIFTYGTLTLNNTTVSENSCVSSGSACLGGGISNDNLSTGNLLMTNSQVVFNTATATGPDGIAIGAGVGISGNFFVSITGSNISHNTGSGTGSGGSIGNGLYLANNSDGTVANLTNSTFNNNSGTGGLAHDGSGITVFNSQRMTGTFNNVTIEGNTGTSRGAGLLLQHNGVTFTIDINNSAIRGNSGGAYGGGVMVSTFGSFAGTSTVNFLNTTISGNSASVIGGGVALASYATAGAASSTVNFLNTTISGNASSGTGGGVHIGQNSSGAMIANFNYTTITNNTANFSSGGGIYAWTGTANLKNSVFAGNIAPIGADLSGTVTSQNYNHIGEPNNDVIINGNTANNGSGNPMLGPLQVNGSGQPTHLPLAGSPLIDKILKSATNCGSPSVALDQRSMSRPQAGRCDIGAAEIFFPAGPFSLSGRVTTADGTPLRNVTVTVTGGALPESGMAIYTGSLGYYSFNSLPGAVYTVAVKSRRFTVSGNVQTVTLNVSTTNVNFTADPQAAPGKEQRRGAVAGAVGSGRGQWAMESVPGTQ